MTAFRYDTQYDNVKADDWQPGDPWDQHYAAVGQRDRDTQLETAISAMLFQNAITWTPVVTQGVNVTYTRNSATYMQVGRKVFVDADLVMTSAGTPATLITMSLPVQTAAVLTKDSALGTGHASDVSIPTRHDVIMRWETNLTCTFRRIRSSITDEQRLGVEVFAAGLASGDIISVRGWYDGAMVLG